jgi:MerR family Zn(II)-responsive transcriptional regulator of zntA
MLIGEFAKRVGVTTDTIRFYGKVGFFAGSRKENGYRVYSERDIETAELIESGKSMGFTLREILMLCRELEAGTLDHTKVQESLSGKVELIDARIRSLKKVKRLIQQQIAICEQAEAKEAGAARKLSAGRNG